MFLTGFYDTDQLNPFGYTNESGYMEFTNKTILPTMFDTPTQTGSDEGLDHILDRGIVVQTKNEITKVTRPDLQRFWGSFKSSHKKGIFVSLHGFTKHCEKFVKDKPILLYDVDDVIGMSEGKKPEWNE